MLKCSEKNNFGNQKNPYPEIGAYRPNAAYSYLAYPYFLCFSENIEVQKGSMNSLKIN